MWNLKSRGNDKMENDIVKGTSDLYVQEKKQYSEEEKKKAAYALNMCTVSVSQMIDYNDSYILEQEYDAILNNLNLKQMPKDEPLLRVITELLNTITFFKIQNIKKEQIEKKYNQRVKNAIWSAVPSLSVVVSGNPVAIAMSIATQVGTSYMNYRKEKNSAKFDKEDAEIELEITAIEQLNSLKRELFTAAWRLADEYDFEDELRITEKQIKQYNAILTDNDELRKYARLESIADRFKAYPPFWYFYGHTANYISEMANNRLVKNKQEGDSEKLEYAKDLAIMKKYSKLAREHFEEYKKLCNNNILREDTLTASFALEYIDILWKDEEKDIDKMKELVKLAEKMAPTSFDVLQLCVISYLKIGETKEAARLLKILVNEDYNISANAKLLSRIYVSQYLFGDEDESESALADYQILADTAETVYLFPIPAMRPLNSKLEDARLQLKYIEEQKMLLQKDYRFVINEFIKANIIEYNKLWPIPYTAKKVDDKYFDYSVESRKKRLKDAENAFSSEAKMEYISALRDSSLRTHYLDLLNNVLRNLDELLIFRNYSEKDDLVRGIRKNIVLTRTKLKEYQEKMENGSFGFNDYKDLQDVISFRSFTEEFFDELKTVFMEQLENIETVAAEHGETPMKYLETAELDLIEFCHNHALPDPEEMRNSDLGMLDLPDYNYYFEYSILGDDVEGELDKKHQREKMLNIVKEGASSLIIGNGNDIAVLLPDTVEFDMYFENVKLGGAGLKAMVIAILDDKTRKDYDLLLTYNGFVIVDKNEIQPIRDYRRIHYAKQGARDELDIGWPDKYTNKDVNLAALYDMIQKLCEVLELE